MQTEDDISNEEVVIVEGPEKKYSKKQCNLNRFFKTSEKGNSSQCSKRKIVQKSKILTIRRKRK